ncbi:MAG: hypothetical protein R6W06_02775, partial [Prochlorococcaceae cyanobacterium]
SNTATTGTDSTYDGLANSNAANDASHPASQWARALTLGGYNDWYVPALYELEILYRRFKPDGSEGNDTGFGTNPYGVPPTTNYLANTPTTTTVTAFVDGGAQALPANQIWTSTQNSASTGLVQDWFYGNWGSFTKTGESTARAIRRIAVRP